MNLPVNLTEQTGENAGEGGQQQAFYEFFRDDPSRNYIGAGFLNLIGASPTSGDIDPSKGWLPFIHPDDADKLAATFDEARPDGVEKSITMRLRHADGHWITVENSALVQRLATGDVFVSGCLRPCDAPWSSATDDDDNDVLRDGENLHKRLLDSLAEGVVVYDADGAVVEYNNTALEILGLSADELTGKTPIKESWGFICEDGTPLTQGELPGKNVLVTRQRERGVVLGVNRPNGEFAWIRVNSEPLHHAKSGAFDGVIVSFADINDVKQAEVAFRERELLYRQMFRNTTAVNILIDPADGRIVDASQAAEALYGFENGGLVGRFIPEIDVDGMASVLKHTTAVLEKGALSFNVQHRLGDGNIRKMQVHAGVIELQEHKYIHTTNIDITERDHYERMLRDANRKLGEERQRLNEIILGTNAGTWEWVIPTGETRFNERWAEIIGYRLDELMPISFETWRKYCHPEDAQKAEEILQRTFQKQTDHFECETRMRHKDGHWVWILTRGKVFEWNDDGTPLRMSGTHVDITATKTAEAEIRRMAQTDQLTGLANRHQFNAMLDKIIQINRRFKKNIVLLLLDLDRFKPVNDTYGHPVGDKLLIKVADIIQRNCREADVVARLGGDEFAVLLPLLDDVRHAAIPAQRIIEEVSQARMIDGHDVRVGISIGISACSDQNSDPEVIYRDADRALYRAKNCGRNRYCFYVEGACNKCSSIDRELCGRNAIRDRN